ncbi:unnamed protein product [Bursaphelenchus okinawaensis]|uniref:Galectin n=1 Tax=Bursaphelenchus okinawaensis TaxID=465554 RepID=A0A811JVE2_9BILA|nr:unnamed protein product [Bursaphelenchus okinawaensis]CAG9084855.1 unnamed protein product [Bursaphelenchus okinawaensis]
MVSGGIGGGANVNSGIGGRAGIGGEIGGGAGIRSGIGSGGAVGGMAIGQFGIGGANSLNDNVQRGIYNINTPSSIPVQFHNANPLRVVVVPTDDWCTINLRQGADIALHFNLRFGQGQCVRNHRVGDSWGEEERTGGFPFERDQIYTIEFIPKVNDNTVEVFVNAQYYVDFRLRSNIEEIDNIEFEAGFKVHSVQAFVQ